MRELITIRLAQLGYPRVALVAHERSLFEMFSSEGKPLKLIPPIQT